MSTLVLDTITGKSTSTNITIGSTPVVSASANSLTIRGEGSNQTSIQQGLGKCWINFEGDGTIAISDSFNASTITDNTTGDYKITYTTNMNNVHYSVTGSGTHDAGSYTCYLAIDHDGTPATNAVDVNSMNSGDSSRIDAELLCTTVHGDLA